MTVADLLRWQRRGYPRDQQSPASLIIHIVVVPWLLAGYVGALVARVEHATVVGIVPLVAVVVSVALQGWGDRREGDLPQPFTGPFNVVARIVLETSITVPRFVCSGKRLRALHQLAPL